MSIVRKLARRYLPRAWRLRVALARRAIADRRAGSAFAIHRGRPEDFPFEVCSYSRPLIDYPGQESLAVAKRRNQALLAAALDRVVVAPSEVFSVWRLADRPSRAGGYADAAALKDGHLVTEVGGAICLLSTAIYNAALLSDMEMVERHCHSVDSYGSKRYFELGRDATIEYGYLDLRFRNRHPFPVVLRVDANHERVWAAVCAAAPSTFTVEITVSPMQRSTPDVISVTTTRTVRRASGAVSAESLGESRHRTVRPN